MYVCMYVCFATGGFLILRIVVTMTMEHSVKTRKQTTDAENNGMVKNILVLAIHLFIVVVLQTSLV